jgi:zinc finger protein
MCTVSIPYFRDILIMSFLCPHCGAKITEVKSGGEITAHGKIITLKVQSEKDLKRDLFKSETAGIEIPELELELNSGTLGGVYTTVEGIIEKILSHLKENVIN